MNVAFRSQRDSIEVHFVRDLFSSIVTVSGFAVNTFYEPMELDNSLLRTSFDAASFGSLSMKTNRLAWEVGVVRILRSWSCSWMAWAAFNVTSMVAIRRLGRSKKRTMTYLVPTGFLTRTSGPLTGPTSGDGGVRDRTRLKGTLLV